MNRKQFLLLLAALALIGCAGALLLKRKKESWNVAAPKAGKALPGFRLNDVQAIHLKGPSDVHVVRRDGHWRVSERYDYPADYHQVRNFLIKMGDLDIVQSEPVAPSALPRVNLAPPGSTNGGGTLVEFLDGQGKMVQSLIVGKKHSRRQEESASFTLDGFFNGRYILLPTDPQHVLLISDELASAIPEPQAWLDRNFFKIEHVKSLAVAPADSAASVRSAKSWKVVRETPHSAWMLIDALPGELPDTNFATQTSEMLEFPAFIDVLPGAASAKAGMENATTATIETFDNFIYTLKIGEKNSQGDYALTVAVAADLPTMQDSNAGEIGNAKIRKEQTEPAANASGLYSKLAREKKLAGWIYLVDSWVEPLLRNRDQILEKSVRLSERSGVE
jgi:hypothetical protein